ncbi:hypothetical protein IKF33_01560 [Candidatus Saccharibacteria bacterium]|nr:hypothetical protein [Candidatus Saccharibacteria bacterium]
MKKVITISTSALAILSMFFISLSTFNVGSSNLAYADSNAKAELNIDSIINISAPNTVTINCTPGSTAATATLCTGNATVSVTTNNITGFTLQMNAANGSPTALTNTGTSPSATLPTLSQSYTAANFPTNYWGYTGGLDKSGETGGYDCASNYCPILAYESTPSNYAPNHVIKVTDAPATTSNTTLTFGAKIDVSKPSGTYSTSVTFTAVTNYVPPTKLANGVSMQEVTSSVCANSDTDVIYTVVDSRDGKEYTAAKLQDGNCWMTQNLALGGSTAMNLTQADSNVGPSGFTLPASSVTEEDWGEALPDEPNFFDYAGNYPSQQSTTKYGNFYNWPAATAGSGTSATIDGEKAPYSICPKNWRLPSYDDSTYEPEAYTMLNNYITTGTWDDYNLGWTGVTTTDFTNAPVSLVFSGTFIGDLFDQGDLGFWWDSAGESSDKAADLQIYSGGHVYPYTSGGRKDVGMSIRCMISGS